MAAKEPGEGAGAATPAATVPVVRVGLLAGVRWLVRIAPIAPPPILPTTSPAASMAAATLRAGRGGKEGTGGTGWTGGAPGGEHGGCHAARRTVGRGGNGLNGLHRLDGRRRLGCGWALDELRRKRIPHVRNPCCARAMSRP